MQAFIVELANQPGSLATVCEALGASGVNITGVAGATSGSTASARTTQLSSAARYGASSPGTSVGSSAATPGTPRFVASCASKSRV